MAYYCMWDDNSTQLRPTHQEGTHRAHTTQILSLLTDCLSVTQAAKENCCQRQMRPIKNKEIKPNYVK